MEGIFKMNKNMDGLKKWLKTHEFSADFFSEKIQYSLTQRTVFERIIKAADDEKSCINTKIWD